MALKFFDRVKDTSTSTGTGVFTVSGTPPAGFRTFSSVFTISDTLYYCIAGQTGSEWEVGIGTYSAANQITRTTVTASSNANAAVTFSAGTKDVFVTVATDFINDINISNTATNQILHNSAGVMSGDADFTWDPTGNTLGLNGANTGIQLTGITTEPTAPAAGNLRLYTKSIGGRMLPKWIGPSGVDTPIQPFMGMNRMTQWWAQNGSATVLALGYAVPSATGTATLSTLATTNIMTQMQKVDALVTVAATTAVAGFRGATANWFAGNAASMGGYFFVMRGGPATGCTTTTSRFFMGMTAGVAAPTDVEPSTIANSIGLGYDAADTNLQIMARNGTAVTKTALTTTNGNVNSAVPTVDRSKIYELVLFCKPNDTTVSWRVTDMLTADQWSGTAAAGTGPVVNTVLAPRIWSSVGGTSSIIGISLSSLYIETDF